MKRKIDELGRFVIPKEIRKELGIKYNDLINIECTGNKIIITNPSEVDYKSRCEKALEYIEIIDNRNTYIEISELRYIEEILKGGNDD